MEQNHTKRTENSNKGKLHWREDEGGVRVWKGGWAGDQFEVVEGKDFEALKRLAGKGLVELEEHEIED